MTHIESGAFCFVPRQMVERARPDPSALCPHRGKSRLLQRAKFRAQQKKEPGGARCEKYGRTSGLKSNGSLQCAVSAERKSRPSLGRIFARHKREKGAESEQPETMQKKEKKTVIQAKAAV